MAHSFIHLFIYGGRKTIAMLRSGYSLSVLALEESRILLGKKLLVYKILLIGPCSHEGQNQWAKWR